MAENCKTCNAPKGLHQELHAYRCALNILDQTLNGWTDRQYWERGAIDMRDFKRVLHGAFEVARKTVASPYSETVCTYCHDTGYEWGLDGRDGPCRHCDAEETSVKGTDKNG